MIPNDYSSRQSDTPDVHISTGYITWRETFLRHFRCRIHKPEAEAPKRPLSPILSDLHPRPSIPITEILIRFDSEFARESAVLQ